MNIQVPERYQRELTRDNFREILQSLGIFDETYIVSLTTRNGRNIIIEKDDRKIYVIFSSKETDSRNAFLNQYIATVLKSYVLDESRRKEIYVYLLVTSRFASTPYMVDTYKMLKTLGISILNGSNLNIGTIEPYASVRDWKATRTERQNYNPGNNSTYVLESEDSYTVYGKSFGANGKETSFICCTIAKIASSEEKRVHLYQVEDNQASGLSLQDVRLLEYYGVIIEKNILPRFEPRQYQRLQVVSTSRDQATFQFNLLNKYGSKKCLICENRIEESIIASHIHRITDIDKSNLSWDEKCKAAVDPDNGFWLCANHDKMFEHGLYYFVDQFLKTSNQVNPLIETLEQRMLRTVSQISNEVLKKQILEFVKRNNDLLVLKDFKIDTIHFSPIMHEYLELHRLRVNGY